jgi:hypothetical protein
MSRQGMPGCRERKSSVREFAASPMISKEAFDCELPDPLFVPGVAAEPDDLRDFVGGVQDVGDPLVVAAAHRSTDSARMARSRPFRPPADTTSTARPNSACSSPAMCMRSNRELSWSKSTSRSMSLAGLSSPRAAEPKRRTLLAWLRAAIVITCSRLDSTSARSGQNTNAARGAAAPARRAPALSAPLGEPG